ncbi:hypothetical protein E2562_037302 [Oryza meyeriana var. granulata]|uniref:Uncharacterized protein n=1 Tax=Oryza meyeriana var. granulata TaxID=110450 RepID=A0A6G1E8R7_9ORYZ|nr:hypothetical protein E2562_037302 [Oryza meyeriana var. granulata]
MNRAEHTGSSEAAEAAGVQRHSSALATEVGGVAATTSPSTTPTGGHLAAGDSRSAGEEPGVPATASPSARPAGEVARVMGRSSASGPTPTDTAAPVAVTRFAFVPRPLRLRSPEYRSADFVPVRDFDDSCAGTVS